MMHAIKNIYNFEKKSLTEHVTLNIILPKVSGFTDIIRCKEIPCYSFGIIFDEKAMHLFFDDFKHCKDELGKFVNAIQVYHTEEIE